MPSYKEDRVFSESKSIMFFNFSDEDFVWALNGSDWTFPAHQGQRLQEGIAWHFAEHLVDKVMNDMKVLAEQKDIETSLSRQENLILDGDEDQLRRLFVNLFEF